MMHKDIPSWLKTRLKEETPLLFKNNIDLVNICYRLTEFLTDSVAEWQAKIYISKGDLLLHVDCECDNNQFSQTSTIYIPYNITEETLYHVFQSNALYIKGNIKEALISEGVVRPIIKRNGNTLVCNYMLETKIEQLIEFCNEHKLSFTKNDQIVIEFDQSNKSLMALVALLFK